MKNGDNIPLDARLLGYAIIELNISRRNVAIYPRDHPFVERTLSNAFNFLRQLFEIRPHITLAVAKDTIIIDNYHLDKKNPVFRDFALTLSHLQISQITFKNGITKDELYRFHRFITEKKDNFAVDHLKKVSRTYELSHMDIGFIDYRTFATQDFTPHQQMQKVPLWERYIYGMLEGTLQGEEVSDQVREIPPEMLASLLNKVPDRPLEENTYDKVITSYMRRTSEGIFSGQDLKRLLGFIENLRPDLKQRFLSSAAKTFSKDSVSTYQSLKNISVEEIEGFLAAMNKEGVAIPTALSSLIDKFVYNTDAEGLVPSAELFAEDHRGDNAGISLASDDLLSIQDLVDFDAAGLKTSQFIEFDNEFNEDLTEKRFNQIVVELMSSEAPSEEDYQFFVDTVKDQAQHLLSIGQYEQILDILKVLEDNKALRKFTDITAKAARYYHSPEFMTQLVDSLKLLGKHMRKDVWLTCDYFDEELVPFLMDALIKEESQTTRRLLTDILRQFGHKIIPEAIKRLDDGRWFVKRNMLYVLRDLDVREVSEHIRPYCRDENPKVSLIALKCLLAVNDSYAIETVRGHLTSTSDELFQEALALAGSFKIKECVGELIQLLNKQEVTGTDISNKIPIVSALGDIAEPVAIDALRALLSAKTILFKKMSDRLKEEIYKTLKNYPPALIKDLAEAGVTSKNRVIREQSLWLQKGNA